MIPARWAGYPPYHDRRYDKVWAACQDLQMPVHTHVGAAPQEDYGEHLGIYVTEVRWWGSGRCGSPCGPGFSNASPAALGSHRVRRVLGQRPALADGHAIPA
ncbi:hypothetical protein I546_6906 [Mycobacterium kansasii 732]|nr:hypothetical protein I546_6906 [Mycobacterium kansasii 732]